MKRVVNFIVIMALLVASRTASAQVTSTMAAYDFSAVVITAIANDYVNDFADRSASFLYNKSSMDRPVTAAIAVSEAIRTNNYLSYGSLDGYYDDVWGDWNSASGLK